MSSYPDSDATAPMHPKVVDAILPFLHHSPGNPSNLCSFGRMARSAVTVSSGATQAGNRLLRGYDGSGKLRSVVECIARKRLTGSGSQEHKQRGGIMSTSGIVGMGKAGGVTGLEIQHHRHYLQQLRDRFESKLAGIAGSVVFGQHAPRLSNTTCFALPCYHGETLLMELDHAGLALCSGSVCLGRVKEPGHVLTAMGIDSNLALNAVRVSFRMNNSVRDVDILSGKLRELVNNRPAVIRRVAA